MVRLLAYLRRNGLLMLLTALFAWLVWVQLSTVFEETWRGEIPVEILLEDGQRILRLSDPRPGRVTVQVRGNRRELDRARGGLKATFRLRVEEVNEAQASQTRTFTAADLRLPKELELVEMSPGTVRVVFAARGTKKVEVKAAFKNTPGDLETLPPLVFPKQVEIVGPAALLGEVESLTTEELDLGQMLDALSKASDRGEIARHVDLVVPPGVVEARPPAIDVLVRFRWQTVRTAWIPLELHWVNPDPQKNPKCPFVPTEVQGVIQEEDGGWAIQVAFRGPRAVLEGEHALDGIRAYMRTDDVDEADVPVIHYEGLPEGVVATIPGGLPDSREVDYELIQR